MSHRTLTLYSFILLAFFVACQPPQEDKKEAAAEKPTAPENQEDAATAEPAKPQEPAPTLTEDVQSEAPAPPEEEKLTAPDGSVMLDCLDDTPEGLRCIPGGPFPRGVDEDPFFPPKNHQPSFNKSDAPNSVPQAEVWVQTFYMDRTEVTYGAYQACVKAGDCPKARPLYIDFDRPNQPMTGMSWYDSVDFCRAQGKHLPTEAEWEKAARGPEGLLHPWGDEPATCELAVIKNKKGRSCGIEKRGRRPEAGRVLEVCSRGAHLYDLCDMVGNAEEWVADWYSHDWDVCGEDCLGVDPKGPCQGAEDCDRMTKAVRGGSWYWGPDHATSIHRRSQIPANAPKEKMHHFGFRCAASYEEAQAILAKEQATKAAQSAPEAQQDQAGSEPAPETP